MMELKPRTKEIARWLVEQHEADNLSTRFAILLFTGNFFQIQDSSSHNLELPPSLQDRADFMSSIEELEMQGFLEIASAKVGRNVRLKKALFEVVHGDFNEIQQSPSGQVVNVIGNTGSPINVAVNVAGNVDQFQVANSEDIATYLRDKLTTELLDQYPELRTLIDEIEEDGEEVSPNRIINVTRWIADLIAKGAITKTGGEAIMFLAGVLDKILPFL